MGIAEEAEIINIPWNDSHDELLRVSAGSDLELIKSDVLAGIAQLWRCEDNSHLCHVVTRIDRLGDGPELCLVCGEGDGMNVFAPRFVNFAKRVGIGFRTHVKRKGLIRMWAKHGVTVDEYILRIKSDG